MRYEVGITQYKYYGNESTTGGREEVIISERGALERQKGVSSKLGRLDFSFFKFECMEC